MTRCNTAGTATLVGPPFLSESHNDLRLRPGSGYASTPPKSFAGQDVHRANVRGKFRCAVFCQEFTRAAFPIIHTVIKGFPVPFNKIVDIIFRIFALVAFARPLFQSLQMSPGKVHRGEQTKQECRRCFYKCTTDLIDQFTGLLHRSAVSFTNTIESQQHGGKNEKLSERGFPPM